VQNIAINTIIRGTATVDSQVSRSLLPHRLPHLIIRPHLHRSRRRRLPARSIAPSARMESGTGEWKTEAKNIPSRPARGIHSNVPSQYPGLRVSFHLHQGTCHPPVKSQSGTALTDTAERYNTGSALTQRKDRATRPGSRRLTG